MSCFFHHTRAVAEIDTDALWRNFCLLRTYISEQARHPTRMIAVVKANAYGHGLSLAVPAFLRAGCDFFAVATLDEAVEVRRLAPRADILILGYTPPSQAVRLSALRLLQTVFSVEYAAELAHYAKLAGVTVGIHLKIDGGMCRLGFAPNDQRGILSAALQEGLLPLGIFTHFPTADTDKAATRCALSRFLACRDELKKSGLSLFAHAAASAALLGMPETILDGVRPGLALYGVSPVKTPLPLTPAMTLACSVVQLHRVGAGTPVGYGGSFVTARPSLCGTVSLGYADGLSRALSGFHATWVSREKRVPVPIIGRICMDQTMLDLTGCDAHVGDRIEIFHSPCGAARYLHTIPYEVLTALSARVPRISKNKDPKKELL